MAISRFLDLMRLALGPLGPHTIHPGTIQGKEGIKFCHLATLTTDNATLYHRVRWWLLHHFVYLPPLNSSGDNSSGGDNVSSSVSGIYDYVENEKWWHDFNNREKTVRGLEQPKSTR